MHSEQFKKFKEVLKKSRLLRVLLILSAVFLLLAIFFLTRLLGYRSDFAANVQKITENEERYTSLQQIIEQDEGTTLSGGADIFSRKSFADFDEVIPFIGYLEALFGTVDPEGSFVIKSNEDQIFSNHYADYEIKLSGIRGDLTNVNRAFDELYNSRFVTNIVDLNVDYRPFADTNFHELNKMDFVVRLFLK